MAEIDFGLMLRRRPLAEINFLNISNKFELKYIQYFSFHQKKFIRPEASIKDDRRHGAEIYFGRAASRPCRQVVFLDYPNINLLKK